MIVISACLAGMKVRYDGRDNLYPKIQQLVDEKKAVTVCPEVFGGLPTPRNPAEIIGGDGRDVLDGKATVVILKQNSPSCGSDMIYNGEFNGTKVKGVGVTTALLRRNGIEVISEENFLQHLL